jgi:hypothetical protein
MARSVRVWLVDIRGEIAGIKDLTQDVDIAKFAASWAMKRAVEHALLIISEADQQASHRAGAMESLAQARQSSLRRPTVTADAKRLPTPPAPGAARRSISTFAHRP